MKHSFPENIETSFDLPETPEGWQITLLGQIAEVVGGGTPKTTDNSNFSEGGYPWITPADLSDFQGIYIKQGGRSLSERGLRSSSAKLMPKGTVLMSSRAPIGYLAIAANQLCTNQGFKSFICQDGVVPEFIYFWLKLIRPFLENMGSGSTFLEISGGRARNIPILLAPTPEQSRIAGKVEVLLVRANAARERLAKAQAILKRFRQAVLSAACSGRLTADWREKHADVEPACDLLGRIKEKCLESANTAKTLEQITNLYEETERKVAANNNEFNLPETWLPCEIKDIGKVCNGSTPSRKHPEYWGGGIPWISSGEVRNNIITETKENISKKGYKNSSVRMLPKGTVLLAMIGEGKTRGQTAITKIEETAAVIIDHGFIFSEYLWYWFQFQYEITRQVGGGTGPQALNCQMVRELSLNLPPFEEQNEIVRRVEALLKIGNSIERRVAETKARVNILFQAILAKAFRGELVPTEAELARREGRSYEPASSLLARIKAECDIASPPFSKKRGKRVSIKD
jgi:type I restriction enzyme S subunit